MGLKNLFRGSKREARIKALGSLESRPSDVTLTLPPPPPPPPEAYGVNLVTTGRVPGLAGIWDHVEAAPDREALLIEVKGWLDSSFSLMLVARLSCLYPNSIVVLAGSKTATVNTYSNGILLPASPQKAPDGTLHLASDRSEEEVKAGYDIVVWCKGASKPDVGVTFRLGGWEVLTRHGAFIGEYSEAFWALSVPDQATREQLKQPPGARLAKGLLELDIFIETFGIPAGYGKGGIPSERPVNVVYDLSTDELIVATSMAAIYQPSLLSGELEDVKFQLAGLLREKLTPREVNRLSRLLLDATPRTDFFDLVRIVKHGRFDD